MDDYEKDLPIVRAVVEKLAAKFPDYRFQIDWVPQVEEFFIRVNDFDLTETVEYDQFVDKLEAELFNQTYCRVLFSCVTFDPTARTGEYETNIPSPSESISEEEKTPLRSAN